MSWKFLWNWSELFESESNQTLAWGFLSWHLRLLDDNEGFFWNSAVFFLLPTRCVAATGVARLHGTKYITHSVEPRWFYRFQSNAGHKAEMLELFWTQKAWGSVTLTVAHSFNPALPKTILLKNKKKNTSPQAGVFPKQDKQMPDRFFIFIKTKKLSSTRRFIFPLHSQPAVCGGLLIYVTTGSCQGSALSVRRRAACRIPAEWVHAGLVCAEMPQISTALPSRVRARAGEGSTPRSSLALCSCALTHTGCVCSDGEQRCDPPACGAGGGVWWIRTCVWPIS